MAKKQPLLKNRTLSRMESLLGVFLALLVPTLLGSGLDLVHVTASVLH